jgi:hypothetical protein
MGKRAGINCSYCFSFPAVARIKSTAECKDQNKVYATTLHTQNHYRCQACQSWSKTIKKPNDLIDNRWDSVALESLFLNQLCFSEVMHKKNLPGKQK